MLVGAALLMPLLVLLTFALLEFGWMFNKAQQVHNAARHGARVGARVDATSADVTAAVQTVMTSAGFLAGTYTITITPPEVGSQPTGTMITVQVTAPYANTDLELVEDTADGWIPAPEHLQSAVSMAKEGV